MANKTFRHCDIQIPASATAAVYSTAKENPGYPLIGDQFNFSNEKLEPERHSYKFSQQVYLIIASMNQIGEPNNNNVLKFMQDIVGANMDSSSRTPRTGGPATK